jgi:hypothetical protein
MHAKPNAGKATWLFVPSFKHDSIEPCVGFPLQALPAQA